MKRLKRLPRTALPVAVVLVGAVLAVAGAVALFGPAWAALVSGVALVLLGLLMEV